MRRAFTMVEMLMATLLVGVVMGLGVMTFNAVCNGWLNSTEYLDKIQRIDYAVNQLVVALRSSYYPSEANENYGFFDPYDREGNRASDSDIIEWTKKGNALIGSKNAIADAVHRVHVQILEKGDTSYGDDDQFEEVRFREPIEVTGLYAAARIDPSLASDSTEKSAREYYQQPTLIAEGVVGFRCRTIKEPPTESNGKAGKNGRFERDELEDTYTDKKFPYKVELTLFVEKEGEFLSSRHRVPIVRVVRIPVYEQAADPK